MRSTLRCAACVVVLFVLTCGGEKAWGAMGADEVLVVYNSQDADSLAVWNHYKAARPGVLGFDLNDPTLNSGTISYADYQAKIQNPLQQHLSANGLAEQVSVLTLTKGLPHRIQDINAGNVGDSPGSVGMWFVTGNATYASVDSELTMLWQNLGDGEAGGTMDSRADNFIVNPYHRQSTSFNSYNRSDITQANTFTPHGGGSTMWTMQRDGEDADAGVMYLTSRLDGHTVEDVKAMIDRSANVVIDPYQHRIVVDEDAGGSLDDVGAYTFKSLDPGYAGDDYDEAVAALSGQWVDLVFDEGTAFLVGESGTVPDSNATVTSGTLAALASYGGNHGSASQAGYLATWEGQLAEGAVMNTMESYNAKQFGGTSGFSDQGQLADWIAHGGTFGVGNVWEPFAFSVADNEYLLTHFFLHGMTWAEAAWSSVPYLSWQQLVLGDPLATVQLLSGDADGDHDVDGADFLLWQQNYGTQMNATLEEGDFDGDGDVDGADFLVWQRFFGTNFSDVPDGGEAGASGTWVDLPGIPEPASAVLMVMGVMGLRRRRLQSSTI